MRAFLAEHKLDVRRGDDGFTYVSLDGLPFVWPSTADVEPLKHLLAELTVPSHPHSYDYGITRLGADDVVLDIGCCEGGFAAKAAAVGATVIAVEPSSVMRAVIERLFELRGLTAPEIKQVLLGPEPGLAYFVDNARDPAQSQIEASPVPGSYAVPISTLDELTATLPLKPTYIKCDAEGADFGILRGGRSFLAEHRPKVAVTTYHHSDDCERIGGYLRSLGYRTEQKGLMFVGNELRVVMLHAAAF